MISAFDPRARYLTGLGAGPSAQAIVGRRRYNRLFMGAFDPRQRYLTGLAGPVKRGGWGLRGGLRGMGQDGTDVIPVPLPTTLGPDPMFTWAATETPLPTVPTLFNTGTTTVAYNPGVPPINFVPSGSVPVAPTAAQISMAASGARPLVPTSLQPGAAPPLSPSWFSATNPTLGISNSTLALGFGFLLVVMVAGSGGKRR